MNAETVARGRLAAHAGAALGMVERGGRGSDRGRRVAGNSRTSVARPHGRFAYVTNTLPPAANGRAAR